LRSPLIVRVDPNLVYVEGTGPVEGERPATSPGLRSIPEPDDPAHHDHRRVEQGEAPRPQVLSLPGIYHSFIENPLEI